MSHVLAAFLFEEILKDIYALSSNIPVFFLDVMLVTNCLGKLFKDFQAEVLFYTFDFITTGCLNTACSTCIITNIMGS